jgi:hypothetical protein
MIFLSVGIPGMYNKMHNKILSFFSFAGDGTQALLMLSYTPSLFFFFFLFGGTGI